jgi:hypothetical protein
MSALTPLEGLRYLVIPCGMAELADAADFRRVIRLSSNIRYNYERLPQLV